MERVEFQKKFGTEESCHAHLYQMRWPKGFVCPKCGVQHEPFHISSRNRYQCKHCNHQASVTSGTVMDKTRVPLTKWFLAMFWMSHDKGERSIAQIGRKLELSYATVWLLCHKIRSVIGEGDTGDILEGHITPDDAFFGGTGEGNR